jgi:hypothetical protein
MSDPHLLRAVWLTKDQRVALRFAVDEVLSEHGDHDLLPSLLAELILVETSLNLENLVRGVVRGLRMPAGTRPVHICNAQVDVLISHAVLSTEFLAVLKPEPERYFDLPLEDEQ